jgi:mitochondrial inner membrane protein COX18
MNLRPLAPCLVRRPPSKPRLHLRPHSRPPFTRTFHSSRPNHIYSETTIQYASSIFEHLHTFSHLPWALSIPLTAILLRTCISLPSYYAYFINLRKQRTAAPLQEAYRNAWNIRTRNEAEEANKDAPPLISEIELGGQNKITVLFSDMLRYNHYFRFLPFIHVPVWWNSCEALRQMSSSARSSVAAALPDTLHSISSLASESCFWIPDLTATDTTLCFIFACLCSANILQSDSQGFTPTQIPMWLRARPRLTLWIHRSGVVLFPALVVLTFNAFAVPAAALLFCVTSSLYALVARTMMRRMVGANKKMIEPARAKTVRMRRAVRNEKIGTDTVTLYARSKSVPEEWDAQFLDRQLRALALRRSTPAVAQSRIRKR